MEIDIMVEDLLEIVETEPNNTVVFSARAKELIHNIAKKCSGIPIVQKTQEQAEKYARGLSAEQVYIDMLYKIVEAPTRIHMLMSARMLIPVISKKLKGEEYGETNDKKQ